MPHIAIWPVQKEKLIKTFLYNILPQAGVSPKKLTPEDFTEFNTLKTGSTLPSVLKMCSQNESVNIRINEYMYEWMDKWKQRKYIYTIAITWNF